MKKGIEWLKEAIGELDLVDTVFISDGVSYIDSAVSVMSVYDLIDKLDEPEVLSQEWIRNNQERKGVHFFVNVNKLQNLVVPEQENINIVLDDLKEHIKEQQELAKNVGLAHTSAGNDTHYRQYDFVLECIDEYEPSDELQNLIIPKQELPVVPKWFDEWWKDVTKGEGNLLRNIDQFHDKLYSYGTREVYDYINDTGNKKKLLNIIINELDYKVEEEQKYYVLLGNQLHDDNWTYALTNLGSIEVIEKDVLPEWDRTKLTEQEIKDYDERYWAFAEPVEEMEE